MKLLLNALIKFIFGIALLGLLLFLPAGTFFYPQAWLFMGILFIPMLIMGIVLFVKSPALLEKRLNNKEKQKAQKGVLALSGLMFPVGFVLSALDFRNAWSTVPLWLTVTASLLFILGYGLYAEVMRENAYLSRTVEVQDGQKVISTGLYGIVRHPMYSATLLLFLSMPLVLGSLYALLPMLAYPALIIGRLLNEEKLLEEELPGYQEYKGRVKYRLIPFIW